MDYLKACQRLAENTARNSIYRRRESNLNRMLLKAIREAKDGESVEEIRRKVQDDTYRSDVSDEEIRLEILRLANGR